MASDYCYSTEMKRAIERHNQGSAQVIPILLRPVHWETAPFAKLQMIPTNATPVTRWPNRDDAFHDVTGHINHFLSERQKQKHAPTKHAQEMPIPSSPPLHSSSQILQPEPSAPLPPPRNHFSVSVGNQQTISFPSLPLAAKPEAIRLLRTFAGHTKDIPTIVVSADGSLLASSSSDQTVKLWNIRTGERFLLPPEAEQRDIAASMALSADGGILAYSYTPQPLLSSHRNARSGFGPAKHPDWSFQVWNVRTSQLVQDFSESVFDKSFISLSGDGLIFVIGHYRRYSNGVINLYHTHKESLPVHKFNPESSLASLALSTNGLRIASGGDSGKVMIWNTQTGELLNEFYGKNLPISSMAFNSVGSLLACGSLKGTINVWNVQKKPPKHLHTLTCATESIALTHDGQLLASASYGEKDILLWDTKSGKLLRTLQSLTGSVSSIALSTDGRLLVGGCSDGTIHIWGIKP